MACNTLSISRTRKFSNALVRSKSAWFSLKTKTINKMAYSGKKKVAYFLPSQAKLFRFINPKFMKNSRNCGLGKNSAKFSKTWLDYMQFLNQKNPDVIDLDNSLLTLNPTEAHLWSLPGRTVCLCLLLEQLVIIC